MRRCPCCKAGEEGGYYRGKGGRRERREEEKESGKEGWMEWKGEIEEERKKEGEGSV